MDENVLRSQVRSWFDLTLNIAFSINLTYLNVSNKFTDF